MFKSNEVLSKQIILRDSGKKERSPNILSLAWRNRKCRHHCLIKILSKERQNTSYSYQYLLSSHSNTTFLFSSLFNKIWIHCSNFCRTLHLNKSLNRTLISFQNRKKIFWQKVAAEEKEREDGKLYEEVIFVVRSTKSCSGQDSRLDWRRHLRTQRFVRGERHWTTRQEIDAYCWRTTNWSNSKAKPGC